MVIALLALIAIFGPVKSAFADSKKYKNWEDACTVAESLVQEGDLVFLDIPYKLFREVASATGTWTSHVGIVFKEEGEWIVMESTVPLSRKVPLCKYLQKSSDFLFEIKRLDQPLTAADVADLKAAADQMLHRFYTFGFDFDSPKLFCSKFVYLAYQAIGVEVGTLQTFRELLEENPGQSTRFWRFWFLGSIPWDRKTVTPASQLNDAKFLSILKGA